MTHKSFDLDLTNIPQEIPEVFAPGFVNTHHHEHSAPTISLNEDEIYWSRWRRPDTGLPQVIMHIKKLENGRWTAP